MTEPADHPLFGKMEQLGQPFEKVLHGNLDALQETEQPAQAPASLRDMTEADFDKAHGIAPAGVPDVAGLTHKLLYWARSSAENRPQAADAMREAADALAALQSQVDELKYPTKAKKDTQAERITELKAKLAEAVSLLQAVEPHDCYDVSGVNWFDARDAFLNKAREVMR